MTKSVTEFQNDLVYNLLTDEIEYYQNDENYFSQAYVKELQQIINQTNLINNPTVQNLIKDVLYNLKSAKTNEKLRPHPDVKILNYLQKEIDQYQSVNLQS